eukprot:scaffold67919_cov57-Phaeocystis_antarctica.AAC.1
MITRSRSRCVTLSCTHMRKSERSGVTTPKRPTCPPLVLAGCERCSSPSPTEAHTNTCGASPEPSRVVPSETTLTTSCTLTTSSPTAPECSSIARVACTRRALGLSVTSGGVDRPSRSRLLAREALLPPRLEAKPWAQPWPWAPWARRAAGEPGAELLSGAAAASSDPRRAAGLEGHWGGRCARGRCRGRGDGSLSPVRGWWSGEGGRKACSRSAACSSPWPTSPREKVRICRLSSSGRAPAASAVSAGGAAARRVGWETGRAASARAASALAAACRDGATFVSVAGGRREAKGSEAAALAAAAAAAAAASAESASPYHSKSGMR